MSRTIERLVVEHDKAIRSKGYRSRRRARLAGVVKRDALCFLDVLHEADHSCCTREGWDLTALKIFGTLVAASVIGTDPQIFRPPPEPEHHVRRRA